jgi:hypothetical protein
MGSEEIAVGYPSSSIQIITITTSMWQNSFLLIRWFFEDSSEIAAGVCNAFRHAIRQSRTIYMQDITKFPSIVSGCMKTAFQRPV